MLTWELVLARMRRFLSDIEVEGRTPRVTDQEIADAWTDAQDDLVKFAARPKTFEVAADLTTKKLPNDLYRIDRVRVDEGDDVNHYTLLPLDATEVTDTDVYEGVYWYLTHTTIEFTQALSYAATVYYSAYYPAPDISKLERPIHVPRWAIQACVYYAAAQCVEKQTIADPQLRQYANRRQDAGNPTHNPFLQVAKYLLERYREQVWGRTSDQVHERVSWHSSYP